MPTELSFEASTLGWPPGHWPETFQVGSDRFHLIVLCHRDGSVEYGCYACPFTTQTAVVFND